MIKIHHQVKNRTNHRRIFNFCKILWKYQNSVAKRKFRGSAQNSAAHGKLWSLEYLSYTEVNNCAPFESQKWTKTYNAENLWNNQHRAYENCSHSNAADRSLTCLNLKLELLSIIGAKWDLNHTVARQKNGTKWRLSIAAVIIRAVVVDVVTFHDEVTPMPRPHNAPLLP